MRPLTADEGHVHRFNGTLISTRYERAVRCACGVWTSVFRLKNGSPPYSDSHCKALETRLRKAKADRDAVMDWRHVEQREFDAYEPETTPTVDAVLSGRRKAP